MRIKGIVGLLACLLVWATLAAAPARGASDPAPGVARLSFIQSGSVVVTHDGAAAADGTVNAPLVPGDVLATADASTRAEIQLDGFTSVRLGGGVRARIVSNDARRPRQISVTAGLVELAVLRGSDLATEIVAPLVTLRTHYAGDYRISVETDGATSVTVRSGQTDVVTPRRTYTVVTGQTLIARGDAADPSVVFAKAIPRDSFDDFNGDRDRTLLGALNGDTHVPASIAGYDDLDAYGSWTGVDSYGQAWVPDQSAGWAPYRDGQWSYAGAYGLTWVGNEPWGWVPYHYGRWIYARNRWCWYPPSLSAVPIWAPALVGFFGYGTGPFGYSGLGWVPLAPGEAYYPAYPWYWYAGIPAVPRHSYPVPAPPPKRVRHRGPPVRMYPLATAFRNAQFGGASAVGAVAIDPGRIGTVTMAPAWRQEFERAATVLSAPSAPTMPAMHATLPAMHATVPAMRAAPVVRATAPVVHATTPIVHATMPVIRESNPEQSPRLGPSHGTLHPPL